MLPFSLNIRGKLYEYTHPAVMGVLNVTPDSFHEGSRANDYDTVCRRVETMAEEGADIIDIGAYSTRPGCQEVTVDHETERLDMAFRAAREVAPHIPLSVDTFRAQVARTAVVEMSADIVNDISGGNMDAEMYDTVAALQVPYVLTHSRGGSIDSLHKDTEYDEFLASVIKDLAFKVSQLQLKGVCDIIVDPGFGLSKQLEQNYMMLINLEVFQVFKLPLLVGVSRKSMITQLLGIKPDEAVNGTTVINTIALQRGASILRVHDVKAAKEAIKICQQLE